MTAAEYITDDNSTLQAGTSLYSLAVAAVLALPGRGLTSSMPAVFSRNAYSKAVSFNRSNLQTAGDEGKSRS
jgi:hypothetical protein